ncbi:MAG: VCBS repeat-containing protein, partial [Nitrospirae bacterium]|nr:VCBS repeat-containing protein [Nitrospirota bacterium]
MAPYWAKQSLSDGVRWMHQRDYDRAETSLMESLRWNAQDPEVWCRLGEIRLTTEDYSDARTAFEECRKRDPSHGDAQAGLWAVRLMEEGYTEEIRKTVRSEMESYFSQEPPSPRGWMAVYRGYQFLHDTEAALPLAFRIMRSHPDDELVETLTMEAAEEILSTKDPQKRLALIEEYLPLFPRGLWHNMVYSSLLKTAAVDLKDTEKLREYAEQWIRQEPDSRAAYASAVYWYLKAETDIDYETTARYLEKAISLIDHPDPRDKPAHYPDALWREDLEKAKGHYYDDLGWAYFRLGQLKDAETAFRQATLLLPPFDHRLYAHLGRFREEQGDTVGALNAYLKSAKGGNELSMAEEGLRTLLSPVPGGPVLPYKVFAAKEGITYFTDVTQEAGLSEISSRRVAWGDYNNDGYEDLLFNGTILMRNQRDGTFRNVTKETGIPDLPGANGGLWADFNNDGFLDFYTFAAGMENLDRLFKNKGDDTFEEVTSRAFDFPDR